MARAATSPAARVLYVDDEEDIRTIVELALQLDPAIETRLAATARGTRSPRSPPAGCPISR